MPRDRSAHFVVLIHGPYTAPTLKRGDRATCLFRDGDVVITGWSNGRIPWPRCRLHGTHGGGTGLLVDQELARAVRTESALAIRYWWGVSSKAVWHWRQALGVERFNEGSTKLRTALNEEIGAGLGGKTLPREHVEKYRQVALADGRKPPQRPGGRPWTEQEKELLGTAPDNELAARFGRTETAVRVMQLRLGIKTPEDRRRSTRSTRLKHQPVYPA